MIPKIIATFVTPNRIEVVGCRPKGNTYLPQTSNAKVPNNGCYVSPMESNIGTKWTYVRFTEGMVAQCPNHCPLLLVNYSAKMQVPLNAA